MILDRKKSFLRYIRSFSWLRQSLEIYLYRSSYFVKCFKFASEIPNGSLFSKNIKYSLLENLSCYFHFSVKKLSLWLLKT